MHLLHILKRRTGDTFGNFSALCLISTFASHLPKRYNHKLYLVAVYLNAKPITRSSLSWLLWILSGQRHLSCSMTKPTKWHVHPVKTQTSPGIHPVWSVSAVHMKKPWVLSFPLSAQRRLCSDWADSQADLSLRWAHKSFCWFCHAGAHFKTGFFMM